jgi:cytochrome P450
MLPTSTTTSRPSTALDSAIDNAIADGKTYSDIDAHHALFTRLRSEDPVHWTAPDGFRPFWSITRHADIIEIERQHDRFANKLRTKLLSIEFEAKIKEAMAGKTMLVRALPQMDNPDHKVYRQLTAAWFQPRQLRNLEGRIQALARQGVDELLEHANGGASVDFVDQFSVWYPLRVIMEILGLPESDEAHLLKITKAYFGGADPEMQRGTDLIEATLALVDYFKEVSRERRKKPRDDVASVIANSTIDGAPIGDFETYSYYIALITAGHDTTSTTSSGGVLALMQSPSQWQLLKTHPDVMPKAIAEIVRWVSPVKHFFRSATQDYVLRGKTIKEGDFLMLCYPSGNRDETVFDAPFSFRVDRTPNRHLGYGYGIHACIGLHLANLELEILFRELLARVDHFEQAGPTSWVETAFLGGLKHLPVHVVPAR